jgi:hypothetical protein
MRVSLLTRAASVAAAAVIATTGAMAVAGAADASVHHRIPTHLSAAKAMVKGSADTRLDGRLTTGFRHVRNIPLGGRLVFLFTVRKMHGKIVLTKVAREMTSTKKGRVGDVSFKVDPMKTTHYVWVFEGTPRLVSSHSRVLTVTG